MDRIQRRALLLDLLNQLSRAIADLHSRGINHRDIKPSNALVHMEGDKYKLNVSTGVDCLVEGLIIALR